MALLHGITGSRFFHHFCIFRGVCCRPLIVLSLASEASIKSNDDQWSDFVAVIAQDHPWQSVVPQVIVGGSSLFLELVLPL